MATSNAGRAQVAVSTDEGKGSQKEREERAADREPASTSDEGRAEGSKGR